MKFCAFCGKPIEDTAAVCPACGAVQPGQPNPPQQPQQPQQPSVQQPNQPYQPQPPVQQAYQQPYPPNGNGYNPYTPYGTPAQQAPNATGYLVWSIIVTLFCNVFGVLGIVYSAMAMSKTATYESAVKNLKLAKIFCIIGTVAGVLIIILSIIWGIAFASTMGSIKIHTY